MVRKLRKADSGGEELIVFLSDAIKGWVWGRTPCGGGTHAGECSAMMCLHGNLPKMAAPCLDQELREAVLNTGHDDAKHPQSQERPGTRSGNQN